MTAIIHSMNCRITSTVVLPSPPLGPGTSWTGNDRMGNGCLSLTPRNAQSGPKTSADGAAGTDGGCEAVWAKCAKVEGQTRSAADDDAKDHFFTLFCLMSLFFKSFSKVIIAHVLGIKVS